MSELSPKPVRSDEEQRRMRFEEGSDAQKRSPEEQRRLMEEYDQARYEEAFPVDEDAEKAYNEAMEAREYEKNSLIEGRILERQDNGDGKEVLVRPEANRMYMMAQQIAELRANGGEAKVIADKENKLQELLEKYTEEAHEEHDLRLRNAEINERSTVKGAEIRLKEEMAAEEELAHRLEEADFIINSTDEAWVNERVPGTEESKEEIKTPKDDDLEKKLVKDKDEARLLAEVEEVSRAIRDNPEEAKKAGLFDRVRELMDEIDAMLAASKESEEKIKEPKDDTDDEKIKEPKDSDLDEEEIKEPKDGVLDDEEKIKEPKDDGDDEKIKMPKDGVLEDEGDKPETKKMNIFQRGFYRLAAYYGTRGGTPAGVVSHELERLRSTDKGKVAAVIGGVAVVGLLLIGRHNGWFDHHNGNGGGGNNPDTGGNHGGDHGGDHGGNHGGDQNGDHSAGDQPAAPATPEIPSGDAYAHPWNWMKAAMENGSIKAPEGMGPEQALHYFGDKAAAAGHKVEWYNLPNGLEAMRVDGNDDTSYISGIIGQVAK